MYALHCYEAIPYRKIGVGAAGNVDAGGIQRYEGKADGEWLMT